MIPGSGVLENDHNRRRSDCESNDGAEPLTRFGDVRRRRMDRLFSVVRRSRQSDCMIGLAQENMASADGALS